MIGLDASGAILASARRRASGTDEILEAIVRDIPPPKGDADAPLRALIFDSWFDPYHGAVVARARHRRHAARRARRIRLMAIGKDFLVTRVCVLAPRAVEVASLGPGEVGILIGGHQGGRRHARSATPSPTPSVRRPSRCPASGRSSRWCSRASIRPSRRDYEALRDAVEKLRLNDSSFTLRARDLARARLRLPLRLPRPAPHGDHPGAARARVRPDAHHDGADGRLPRRHRRTATAIVIDSPAKLPPPMEIEHIEEPYIRATIHLPTEFLGNVLAALPGPPRRAEGAAATSARRASWSPTSCRSPRSSSTSTTS